MAKTAIALIIWLCLALPAFAAQPAKQSAKPARPAWSELTPAQQQVLAPLAAEWTEMDSGRRKKWVAIADRYPKMKPADQQRLQKRMKDWAALTPAQRQAARTRYQELKKLTPVEESPYHRYAQQQVTGGRERGAQQRPWHGDSHAINGFKSHTPGFHRQGLAAAMPLPRKISSTCCDADGLGKQPCVRKTGDMCQHCGCAAGEQCDGNQQQNLVDEA